MPSLTQPFSRKRRRDGEDTERDIHIPIPQGLHGLYPHDHHQHQHPHHSHNHNHGASPMKPIAFPSPLAKKIRMSAAAGEWLAQDEQRQALLTTPAPRHNRSPSATARQPPSARAASAAPTTNLSPCHICRRKPTKKTELDSYADCEGCGERTCYVCIRECLGWKAASALPTPTTATAAAHDGTGDNLMRDDHGGYDKHGAADDEEAWEQSCFGQSFSMEDAPWPGEEDQSDGQSRTKKGPTWGRGGGGGHRGRICSQCCVEEGPEGEVICLGCLGT